MISTSQKKLNQLKKKFNGKKIAVIGDMMLDSYFWGSVSRVSPEAPVPVVEIDDEFQRFGGAMNVAYNILTLGGTPIPIGILGNDQDAEIMKDLMKKTGINSSSLIIDNQRPTTNKTRVIANNQHVVRIDKEKRNPISSQVEAKIINTLKKNIKNINAIILEDYNKGVLTQSLIRAAIKLANENEVIITVDPKFNNFFEYQNVTVFKPNRKETEDALGIRIQSSEDLKKAGHLLLEKLNAKYVLLTLGEEGISLFQRGKSEVKIATKARKVADVSGAGDTVISTLTMALCAGANIYDAAYLANYAGGLVCQEVGIVPISLDYLFKTVGEEI
ncbi:MAG: D-glycero-beta-D-manno-heptose-7-phosphate kinase [Melioribacteraceae bacterium]|jgi:rfaE bifunctional protein kinase chain/domain|nr:D-glycero-beta-D-manno-heptose-7-phosphate kinase [Melioribacteraceae bacterium]